MSVLAVDTSSRHRTVCVVASSTGTLVRSSVSTGVAVDEALPRAIAALADSAPAAVVVVTGPGAYTGLRAGMAAALGVAQALGVPIHGVGTLDVVAAGAPLGPFALRVAVDAGRGAAYVAECVAEGDAWLVRAARRVPIASIESNDGVPASRIASTDAIAVPDLIAVDPAVALAMAVPRALGAAALAPESMSAVYIE